MEEQLYAHRMQQETIREIETNDPRYLVFVNIPASWNWRGGSETSIFGWYREYAAALTPCGLFHIFVLERKAAAPG